MRTAVLVNPVAGRGQGRRVWRKVERAIRPVLGAPEVCFTDAPGSAARLANELQQQGYGRLVIVGGDGTLHEVVNGLDPSRVVIGMIPGGTGNDFSRCLGIPREPLAAVEVLARGEERRVDLGLVNGQVFTNVAGIGFDARVADEVNRHFRRLSGTAAYLAAVFKVLWSYRNVPVSVSLDGQAWQGKVFLLAVGNAQYYGGGMRIVPSAILDDGYFHVCLAGDVGRRDVLLTLPRVFSGRHVEHPLVEERKALRVVVDASVPLAVHADGEIVSSTPAEFTVLPAALRVLAPAD